jgi:hypothetical protein
MSKTNQNINVNGDSSGDIAGKNIDKRNIKIFKFGGLSLAVTLALAGGGFAVEKLLNINIQQILIQQFSPQHITKPHDSPVKSRVDNDKKVMPNANPFDKEIFPKPVCGDSLPLSSSAYPVQLYPVLVDYTQQYLQKITSSFCADAIRKNDKDTAKEEIQVASFLDANKARLFQEFLGRNFSGARVGKPTKIESNPSANTPSRNDKAKSLESERTDSENFTTLPLRCGDSPVAKFKDLEFSGCKLIYLEPMLTLRNYSSDWYGFQLKDGTSGLIPPASKQGIAVKTEKNFDSVKVKQYSGKPTTSVTISCDDQPKNVWKITFKPKCNSGGSYIDVDSAVSRTTTISIPGARPMVYSPQIGGGSGYITSSSRQIVINLSID